MPADEPAVVTPEQPEPDVPEADPAYDPADDISVSSESEIYGPDGELYVEYTLDYYLANAFAGDEESYNLDYYQYVCPFVGRWLNTDGSGEGYYFYSDEFITYAYADGAVEPFAWDCYLDEEGNIVDPTSMIMFTIQDGMLIDSEGNTYEYSHIEYPYDVADSSYYGYWQFESNPNNYVQISREGEIVKVHDDYGDMTGYFEMENPYTMYLLDEDGNRMYRFTMTAYGQAILDGEEVLYYYEDQPNG